MMDHFKLLKSDNPGYWALLILLSLFGALGYGAAHFMDAQGHWVSGMNNQVVWGLPHVFAIFLILSASGALNVASMSSVFSQKEYKPWARSSALLSICLLVGGLLILVLDLGRPERLIVAMTHYNFKSIFAWNIFLYMGFLVMVTVYLWTLFERGMDKYTRKSGFLAFIWRFVLTSGTGSIFGFLVARQFFDSAMMVPIFIVLSLILGTALFVLVVTVVTQWSGIGLNESVVEKISGLLIGFVALELFLVTIFHLTNLYSTGHHDLERFILLDGQHYTVLFWLGQVLMGGVIPLLFAAFLKNGVKRLVMISSAAVIGGFSQLYVTIISGQAFPMALFPGKNVSSKFFDGVIANYVPRFPELLLGLGGVAVSFLLLMLVMRVLPFLPDNRVFKTD
ncbi:MAG: molybdopterin oxidoreductase [Gammaproteobacteria bacterium]|nr:molybdopterin oxidoreductase [Gammaproteobacteria bacterium]NKB64003.1 molybdopterin oxidoreductase [Gammaproteobacteria bacterium]